MKTTFFLLTFVLNSLALAADKINLNFKNEEITKVIEVYSKNTGQKFVIEPSVRGKITLLLPEPVPADEAFNHLSTALALNSYAISTQGDTMVVRPARTITRDHIEVVSELPALKPERMVSWVYTAKYIPADTINREVRMLLSRDGEMNIVTSNNQLIFTDWTSTLSRVDQIMKKIDVPVSEETRKLVEKTRQDQRQSQGKKTGTKE